MIKKTIHLLLLMVSATLLWQQCASSKAYVDHFDAVVRDLKHQDFQTAIAKVEQAKETDKYSEKERVLYYLDRGIILYYKGDHKESIRYLEQAEQAVEELFTRSISQAATSFLLNDNVIAYHGEIYENVYINIFKALNYIKLDQLDEAYVEVKRVNIKLRELDDKYGEMAREMNRSKDSETKVEYESTGFYNDALAHYLSYLIFRAEREEDNSRISFEKINNAWETQPSIYYFDKPDEVQEMRSAGDNVLTVIGFTGAAPVKKPVGGLITTYDDYVGISDLSMPIALPNVPFPGMKAGYHFKFAFPVIETSSSQIAKINVLVDGKKIGQLELFEDMGRVAETTFESRKKIIYIKTVVRTVTKGIAAAQAKKKLRKETNANGLFGALLDAAVDVGVDATEKPDLRCWRTMPQYCYIGEFTVSPGVHDITINCLGRNGQPVFRKNIKGFEVKERLNLIDFVTLN